MDAPAPSCRIVTQIGSVPFRDIDRAVEYSLRHEIPFLPELTARGDRMLEYAKHPGRLSALRAFQRHRFEVAKVQCVGPATLILSGYDEDRAMSIAYRHLDAIFAGLIAEKTILFLDEPALGHVGFDYVRLWEPLFESFPATRGVHTCGNMQWDVLATAPIDIISFDASRYDVSKYLLPRRTVRVSWGISRPEDARDFRDGDLLTLPCGLPSGTYSEIDAEARLRMLQSAAAALRT